MMWTFLLLVAALITCSAMAGECPQGLFGRGCRYKCHCQSACDDNGECLDKAGCQPGWFGPACQYVDMANDSAVVQKANGGKITRLTDGDDQTCFPTTSTTKSVNLTWTEPFLFTWMRIHGWDQDLIQNISVRFGSAGSDMLDCRNPRNATVNCSTLDLYCDLERPITSINLAGGAVKTLCSVYVSGGRNVAFLGNATQSSTFSGYTKSKAINAVDGNRSQDYEQGSCSHTDIRQNYATWNITFSLPQLIQRILIYNRNEPDGIGERLRGFILKASSSSNTTFTYTDRSDKAQGVYKLPFETNNTPISRVGIQATNRDLEYNSYFVTLCEVEIYGDSDCPAYTYGRECEETCNCTCPCFVSTGACPSACSEGQGGKTCPTPTVAAANSRLVGPVIGVVAAVILVLAAVVAGFICWRRRRHSKAASPVLAQTTGHLDSANHVFGNESSGIMMHELPKANTPAAGNISGAPQSKSEEYYNLLPASKVSSDTQIAVKELDIFMSTHDKRFFQEQFASIPANEEATMTVGQSSENKNKNRYKNICAYDHSRVRLQASKHRKHGDYINASYVEGYKREELFIATQGPTKAILGDFAQMLWEQQVEKVVMLTNLVEDGKLKCERYWPEDGAMKVGDITVKLATTQVFADYTIRVLQLAMKGGQLHTVTHFHFTSWPDKDVPTAPWGLVDFEQRVASYPTTKPVVVHCSAGVGRTGTFIALRNVMRQAEDTGYVDVFTTVKMLRQNRVNMVQTAEQYEFLHKSAQVAILCLDTTVSASDVHNRIQTLSLPSEFGNTKLDQEFQAVSKICSGDDQRAVNNGAPHDDVSTVYENSLTVANVAKNRFTHILPKEYYRVMLQAGGDGAGDYINAVFVPSFTKPRQHILTQLPLPTTVADFWRMVTQYKVSLIVAFEADSNVTDQTVGTYLPQAENDVIAFDDFSVRTEQIVCEKLWQQQEVVVTGTLARTTRKPPSQTEVSMHLTHLMCKNTDLNADSMLSVVKQVRSLVPTGEGRVLYMCRNGGQYCGLACILSLLLDRMDSDKRLTIPLVVGAIKAIRPQVIPTLTQYRLLYDVLRVYIDSINVYNNF
ncbi:hypothetical protein BsWGS_14415 [Bradybaena similaris]